MVWGRKHESYKMQRSPAPMLEDVQRVTHLQAEGGYR